MNLARKIKRTRQKLHAKGFRRKPSPKPLERLFAVALQRNGKIIQGGQGSHWRIRFNLDPHGDLGSAEHHIVGDVEGFITTTGRFVNREDAYAIALNAGQCNTMSRTLLSSDVRW